MHDELRKFLLGLATDVELLNRFVAAPAATAREAGLSDADREILFSGDQNQIYVAITGPRPPAPQPQPSPPPPVPQYGWAWTPWGWQWLPR